MRAHRVNTTNLQLGPPPNAGSLILVNKHLLVDLKFHYPLTVALSGMCSSFVFSYIACKRYGISKAQGIDAAAYVRTILPIGVCMALTLHLGNLVYFYLSVSFIQMLKVLRVIHAVLRPTPSCHCSRYARVSLRHQLPHSRPPPSWSWWRSMQAKWSSPTPPSYSRCS